MYKFTQYTQFTIKSWLVLIDTLSDGLIKYLVTRSFASSLTIDDDNRSRFLEHCLSVPSLFLVGHCWKRPHVS